MARTMTTSTKGLRALVLDADPASLRSLAWSLEARFISVCTAPDGTRAAAPEPEPELESVTVRFALPFARNWSMLPA
jgi:hypothetical protein